MDVVCWSGAQQDAVWNRQHVANHLGHHTACAEIKGLRFSGLFAWMLWRTIYLAKLPGVERKAHVLGDWTIELFFPRDIAQTVDLTPRRKRT